MDLGRDLGDSTIELLQHGDMASCELNPIGSNYTFLVSLKLGECSGRAIYKPRQGEAPLWDFSNGTLYKREYASYLLSQALGWNFIPATVVREGRYGIGSLQQYVEHDPRQNYYTLTPTHAPELRAIVCFDLVANNTDRKAGHLLVDWDGKLWGIDHGLTFHAQTKIRTVVWDFSGAPIPEPLLAAVEKLSEQINHPTGQLKELLDLLEPDEIAALQKRLGWVLAKRVYPGVPRMQAYQR